MSGMPLKSISDGGAIILPWTSYEEYAEYIQAEYVERNLFRHRTSQSLLDQITELQRSADAMSAAAKQLSELGYDGDRSRPSEDTDSAPRSARGICIDLCHHGEEVLMYAKGLAQSHEADDFLHEKDILEHWDRYEGSDRIHDEINELVAATWTLCNGLHNAITGTEEFLLDQLDRDFPDVLKRDFIVARDQFSVGLEEAGFLSAGRGLEGVLRAVAQKKLLLIETRGVLKPAAEEDFFDLIECLSRTRWRTDKSPIISQRIKSLLHHIRTSRNAVAHPVTIPIEENWRELAVIVTSNANRIWKVGQRRYAGLREKKIVRSW